MLKKTIADKIESVLNSFGITDVHVQVEYPADPKHGDYASNVAMTAFSRVKGEGERGKSPRAFAEALVAELEKDGLFASVSIAGPGFINFTIKDEKLLEIGGDSRLCGNDKWKSENTRSSIFAGKKVIVEYTDPNPFKEFHIGHLYSNIVGESLSRLLEANGAEVRRADYFGDVGMHVAKTLWGLEQKFQEADTIYASMEELEQAELPERIKFFGEAYAKGATAYKDDESAAEIMQLINRHVYLAAQQMWQEEKGLEPTIDYKQGRSIDPATLAHILSIYRKGRAWSLAYFETIYARLGTKFDAYYPESIAGERGYQLVKYNQAKGIFVESEGAVVFPEEKSGLHTRVFINKLGLPTYEAKELGLAPWKYEEFPYDLSLIVTGNEINEYFKVLISAMKHVNPELGDKTTHLSHGMVKLPEGKMSSRTGKILRGEWLLDEAKSEAKKLSDDDAVAEMVGVGAVKYALLKGSIGKDVEFNFEESVSFEGNSGPYLQYTYARTQSVLRKSENREWRIENGDSVVLNDEERELARLLSRFDEVIEEAAIRYSPNTVASYLFELAQSFNGFYQKHQILKADADQKAARMHLTYLVGRTLKRGLYLLGIATPEKM